MKKTILVTGGAGYIGSHTCKALAASGWLPVAYDNLSTGHGWAVKWGPLERGELSDGERLDAVLAQYRPEAIVHFAASAYVGESYTDPAKYYQNNVVGSLSLLNAARRAGVMRIVFSSSCATYGMQQAPSLDETHPQAPINPYGFTKLAVEHMLRDFAAAYGMGSIALRYFNAAGADAQGEAGEVHDPETHLIPLVLGAGLGTRPPVTVFGTDYNTADGTCVRDYIHVSDLAAGHVAALENLVAGPHSRAYNLGVGRGYSVRDIIDRSAALLGRPVPHVIAGRRPGDPDSLVCNADRARTELGWQAVQSDLDNILSTAIAWAARAQAA